MSPLHPRAMNQIRLTTLSASFLMNESGHPCGIVFVCPVCASNCWIEARWSDRLSPKEPVFSKAGSSLETLTLSPGIDTEFSGGCGFRGWVHDGEVLWEDRRSV